jgi:hypothetical protein
VAAITDDWCVSKECHANERGNLALSRNVAFWNSELPNRYGMAGRMITSVAVDKSVSYMRAAGGLKQNLHLTYDVKFPVPGRRQVLKERTHACSISLEPSG